MLRIEFEDPKRSECECCGNSTVRLTRFVYRDNDAYAIYYALFTPQHPEKIVCGVIGMGEWGDDHVGSEARFAFPFEIRATSGQLQVGLVDADTSPWSDAKILGRILNRDEALKHEWISEVFHITDHMVTEDREIVRYFDGDAA